MQTEADAARVRELCGDGPAVFVTGNCKFDVAGAEVSPARRAELAQMCGLAANARVLVAGSTHTGEEQIILSAFKQVREREPAVRLILAPRHPERFQETWELLTASGIPARRLSDMVHGEHADGVVLIDRMGLLAELYALADIAIVAGSFVPGIGGHNLLEAAVHGVPVVFGPHMEKQPDMVRILDAAHGGIMAGAEQLGDTLARLLANPAEAREKGLAARDAVLHNRGSARRNMEVIEQFSAREMPAR
jgi:3-deoxy-D-manno-octulosonic-acid transferase